VCNLEGHRARAVSSRGGKALSEAVVGEVFGREESWLKDMTSPVRLYSCPDLLS
jgi:hypothetical protein